MVGKDQEGSDLIELLNKEGIETKYIIGSETRVTTNKVRVMGRHQQMMRLDHEQTDDISKVEELALLKAFFQYVDTEKPSLVILEDYNKGVLTEHVITSVIAYCKERGIPTAVDPKKKNFLVYKDCTIFFKLFYF